MESIGEKIIDAIIKQGMFRVAHPDPGETHIFVWSSSAAEQLEALVADHIRSQSSMERP